MAENIDKIFKKLQSQVIEKFSVKTVGAEQYFYLITDKTDIKFVANDLGVWIEKYKIKKIDKKKKLKR